MPALTLTHRGLSTEVIAASAVLEHQGHVVTLRELPMPDLLKLTHGLGRIHVVLYGEEYRTLEALLTGLVTRGLLHC